MVGLIGVLYLGINTSMPPTGMTTEDLAWLVKQGFERIEHRLQALEQHADGLMTKIEDLRVRMELFTRDMRERIARVEQDV